MTQATPAPSPPASADPDGTRHLRDLVAATLDRAWRVALVITADHAAADAAVREAYALLARRVEHGARPCATDLLAQVQLAAKSGLRAA